MRDRRATSAGVWIATAAAIAGAAGCDLSNPGIPARPADVNFPIALAVVGDTPEASFLVVVNSNFDLGYSSGTLQSWSLPAIRAAVDAELTTGCGAPDVPPCAIDIEASGGGDFLVDEVQIGSHADGLAVLRSATPQRTRLYVPVRSGRGVLTWLDFAPDTGLFACGGSGVQGELRSCSAEHAGADVAASAADVTLPTDPVAVAVVPSALLGPGATSDAVVVAHRSGRASLFLDDPTLPRPVLTDVISGISNDIVSAVLDPSTGLVWVTSAATQSVRATNELLALGPIVSATEPGAARLAVVRRIALTGISDGLDTRDITFDPDPAAERAWVLSRRPESVITLDFSLATPSAGLAPIGEIFAVAAGPSRILRVEIGGRTLLVVSAYDANNVSVVDPELGLVATVAGLTGPFEMAFDASRSWLFVTNFRSSTIAVVDLAPLETSESPRLVATLAPSDPPNPF